MPARKPPTGDWVDGGALSHDCILPKITVKDLDRPWKCECGKTYALRIAAPVLPNVDDAFVNNQVALLQSDITGAATLDEQQVFGDLEEIPRGRMPDFSEMIAKARAKDQAEKEESVQMGHTDSCARTLKTGTCNCHMRNLM